MLLENINIAVCWIVMEFSLVARYYLMEVCASYTTLFHMPEDYMSHEAQEEVCINLSVNCV